MMARGFTLFTAFHHPFHHFKVMAINKLRQIVKPVKPFPYLSRAKKNKYGIFIYYVERDTAESFHPFHHHILIFFIAISYNGETYGETGETGETSETPRKRMRPCNCPNC